MKRILKKNQIIITALAIMIAVAGYINYKDLVSKHAKDARQTNVSLALGETDAQTGDLLSNDAEPDDFSSHGSRSNRSHRKFRGGTVGFHHKCQA